MQATATTTRRFDSRKIKQAALAIGLLTSLAIGATTASIVRDTADTNNATAVLTGAAATRNEMGNFAFREQNLYLPNAGTVQKMNADANHQFMEQNLYLPVGAVATTPDWRVIEQNSWGEDFSFAASGDNLPAPSPDDGPQQIDSTNSY